LDTSQLIMLVVLAVAVVAVGLLTSRRQDTAPALDESPVAQPAETRRERSSRRTRQP
jgi:hypothetical protein